MNRNYIHNEANYRFLPCSFEMWGLESQLMTERVYKAFEVCIGYLFSFFFSKNNFFHKKFCFHWRTGKVFC